MEPSKKATDVQAEVPLAEARNTQTKAKKDRVEAYGDVLTDGTIVESIYRPNENPACAFVIGRPGEEPVLAASFPKGASIVLPPERSIRKFEKRAVLLASGIENYGSSRDLLNEICSYISKYVDFDSFEISLLAHYALMTWVWDAWDAFPYLRFKGEPGTGKTCCLKVMKELCYRSTDLGVSPSRSALFRTIDRIRGTLLIDEADYESDLRSDLIKLLNAGYLKEGSVSLSVAREEDWEPESFSVGSPKIMANRLCFKDSALETRCITIHTVSKKLSPHIRTDYSREFLTEGKTLRNKLLCWRMDMLHSVSNGDDVLTGIEGRARQLGLPIYTISPDPEFKVSFLKFLKQRGRSMREHDPLQITISAIARVPDLQYQNRILLKDIREAILAIARERDIPEYQFSIRRVAELVRGLQFDTSKWGVGTVVYRDPEILRMQIERFGVRGDGSDGSDDAEERDEELLKAAS